MNWVVRSDLAGDRVLLTDARIREEVRPAGPKWVTALRPRRSASWWAALQANVFRLLGVL